jgi:hypothetical protein
MFLEWALIQQRASARTANDTIYKITFCDLDRSTATNLPHPLRSYNWAGPIPLLSLFPPFPFFLYMPGRFRGGVEDRGGRVREAEGSVRENGKGGKGEADNAMS